MKVIKNINNNIAVCIDSKGIELVAFGKGIGFKKAPYEIDIKQIDRTYYNLDSRYLNLLETIDENALQIAMKVKDYIKKRNMMTGENFVFSLADHIDYAVERLKNGVEFQLPIANDIQQMFPKELEAGKYALKLINKQYQVQMKEDEAIYIALNILNSEYELNAVWKTENKLVDDIVDIVAQMMKLSIDKSNFSYSRFVSHLYYLLHRTDEEPTISNSVLLKSIQVTSPKAYECALEIKKEIDQRLSTDISEDEVFYLTLHITRLCERRETK